MWLCEQGPNNRKAAGCCLSLPLSHGLGGLFFIFLNSVSCHKILGAEFVPICSGGDECMGRKGKESGIVCCSLSWPVPWPLSLQPGPSVGEGESGQPDLM